MNFVSPECAAQSMGPANELFGALVQTILAVQCSISPSYMWPKDYGPDALQHGKTQRLRITPNLMCGRRLPFASFRLLCALSVALFVTLSECCGEQMSKYNGMACG